LGVQADIDLFQGQAGVFAAAGGVEWAKRQAATEAADGFEVDFELPGRVGRVGRLVKGLLDSNVSASLKVIGLDIPRS
jgi:hypothetical protein